MPSRCRRWSCKDCGWRNAQKLATRLNLTTYDRFLTLPLKFEPTIPTIHRLDSANHAWRLLWKRIKRRYRRADLGYCKVVEFTKLGSPHLHIALKAPFIPQKWLSEQWNELTGSSVIDIRKIRSERGLARYLSKYLTKSGVTLPHRRKYAASRGFLPPLPEPTRDMDTLPPAWRWSAASVDGFRASLLAAGWSPVGNWLVETLPPRSNSPPNPGTIHTLIPANPLQQE